MERYRMFIDWKIQYFPDINHYRINEWNLCNTNQYLNLFLVEIVKLILNWYCKIKGPKILNAIFKGQSKVEDLHFLISFH